MKRSLAESFMVMNNQVNMYNPLSLFMKQDKMNASAQDVKAEVLSQLEMLQICGGTEEMSLQDSQVAFGEGIKFNISHNCKPLVDLWKICI